VANLYRTRDDRWIQLVMVREDKLWPALCRTIGRPELENDPRFIDIPTRRSHAAELAAILADAFAARDYDDWRRALAAAGVTFGAIRRVQDLPDDEQAVHAGAIVEAANHEMPRTLANPIRLDFAQPRVAGPGPVLGAHPDEVLREAGLSDA